MLKFQALDDTQREEAQKSSTSTESNKIHSIPFVLSMEGPARVNDFFEAKIKEETDDDSNLKARALLRNSLHGRALKGNNVKMQNDIIGKTNNCYFKCLGIVYERDVEKDIVYKPQGVFNDFT